MNTIKNWVAKRKLRAFFTGCRTVCVLLIVGVFSLIVTGIVFYLGLKLYTEVFRIIPVPSEADTRWNLFDGIVGLATASLFIGGLAFALLEYIRSERRQAQEDAQISYAIYESLFDRLMNDNDIEARRWIIQELSRSKDEDNLTDDEWVKVVRDRIHEKPPEWEMDQSPGEIYVKRTLNTLDFMGFVARNYVDVDDVLMPWMSPPIAKSWKRLSGYVLDERKPERRNADDFYADAEFIGKACVKWRAERAKQKGIEEEENVVPDTV